MKTIIGFILVALAAAMPAQAEDRDYGTVGGFDLMGESGTPTSAGSCFMMKEHEGPGSTRLVIVTSQLKDTLNDSDTRIGISVTNDNWTSTKGNLYPDIKMALNGYLYSGEVLGMELLTQKGFGRTYDLDVLNDLALGSDVRLYRGEKLFEHLDLEGSGAAIKAFRRCLATRSTEMARARAERDRFKHLERNPFDK